MKKLPRKARSHTGKPDRVSAREDRRRRFASGALLFAKIGPDRNALVRQLLDHTPARQYLAVLRGQSLVVLGADPAHDTAASSKVRYTIRNGKVIYSEK